MFWPRPARRWRALHLLRAALHGGPSRVWCVRALTPEVLALYVRNTGRLRDVSVTTEGWMPELGAVGFVPVEAIPVSVAVLTPGSGHARRVPLHSHVSGITVKALAPWSAKRISHLGHFGLLSQ